MLRTDTTQMKSFARQGVVFQLSTPKLTTIRLPPGSMWTSGLHWHETHTEYLQVVQGRAEVTLSGSTATYGPDDGVITVPRMARHEWKRASGNSDDELVVKEWTDPADGSKEIFFRNLNSVILETKTTEPFWMSKDWWITLQLFIIFYQLDNWPVLPDFDVWASCATRLVTHIALGLAWMVGKLLGLQGTYDEYTPIELRKGARARTQ